MSIIKISQVLAYPRGRHGVHSDPPSCRVVEHTVGTLHSFAVAWTPHSTDKREKRAFAGHLVTSHAFGSLSPPNPHAMDVSMDVSTVVCQASILPVLDPVQSREPRLKVP
jgi:hypothetical protein